MVIFDPAELEGMRLRAASASTTAGSKTATGRTPVIRAVGADGGPPETGSVASIVLRKKRRNTRIRTEAKASYQRGVRYDRYNRCWVGHIYLRGLGKRGRTSSKSFAVRLYGDEKARQLACAWRKEAEGTTRQRMDRVVSGNAVG